MIEQTYAKLVLEFKKELWSKEQDGIWGDIRCNLCNARFKEGLPFYTSEEVNGNSGQVKFVLCDDCYHKQKTGKPWPEKIEKMKELCYFCEESIAVFCGTPLILLGGCCYGYVDKKSKVTYIFPRKAHVHCWLKHENLHLEKQTTLTKPVKKKAVKKKVKR